MIIYSIEAIAYLRLKSLFDAEQAANMRNIQKTPEVPWLKNFGPSKQWSCYRPSQTSRGDFRIFCLIH